jgi:Putative DNA-binding domain
MMQIPTEELIQAIETEGRIWLRLGLKRRTPADDWNLAVIDITAGAEPPAWLFVHWVYDTAIFWAAALSGKLCADSLRSRSIDIDSETYPLPSLTQAVHTQGRRSSGFAGIQGSFPWPYEEWTFTFDLPPAWNLEEPLIGDGATPSFLTENLAIAEMLRIKGAANTAFDQRSNLFRRQFPGARIIGVRIFPTHVAVEIEGTDVAGSFVELAGAPPGEAVYVRKAGRQVVEIPVPGSIPQASWVLLKRKGKWLDRRFLELPYARGQANDVRYFVEPATQIEALVAAGESSSTEFKREIPADKLGLAKTVSAFANGTGGTILIGVEDDGNIIGLSEGDPSNNKDSICNVIRNWISPLPPFDVENVKVGGVSVIAITVESGAAPPYGAGTTTDSLRYYVRRGATTFVATPDQVREITRRKPIADSSGALDLGYLFKG